jgi:hypothetical protein
MSTPVYSVVGTITIGTRSSQSGNTGISPYNYYSQSRRVQFVILASEMISQGGLPGNISAIAWDVQQINGGDLVNYTVRLAHTTSINAASHNNATLTTVVNPFTLVPGATGWRTLTFDTPFSWDGTSNLLVDVCWGVNAGSGSSGIIWLYSGANQMRGVANATTSQCDVSTTTPRSGKPRIQLTMNYIPPGSLNGYVRDYYAVPISGARVAIQGGGFANTNASGYYSFAALLPNTYTLNVTKTGFNPATASVTITSGNTTVQDFILNNPQIAIDKDTITKILLPGEIYSEPIVVKNDGNGNLGWTAAMSNVSYIGPEPDPPAGYCANSTTQCDEYISQVAFGTIINPSGCTLYSDFTSFSTAVLTGVSHYISIKIGPPYYNGDRVKVYIDWDQNLIFDESPYLINTFLGLPQGQFLTGSITVPANALLGKTRMRLMLNYQIDPDPCTPYTWGEIEDYSVMVAPGSFLSFSPTSGNIAPFGGTQSVTATLNATDFIPGAVYAADIVFSSNPAVGTKTTHVSVTVADPNLAGPTDFQVHVVNPAEGKIRLTWNYWADAVIDHFMIMKNGEVFATTKKMYYMDILTQGEYCYKVYAVYNNGHFSPPSNEVCLGFPFAPSIPLNNWALILAAGLIVGFTVFLIRKRG